MSVDQQFNIINEKLQQLLKNHARLKRENERLREELREQKQLNDQATQTIDEFYQQMAILKMAAGTMSDKDKKDFEKKVNQYIRDIDKCIAYLSQ